jgi:hypothetical protein
VAAATPVPRPPEPDDRLIDLCTFFGPIPPRGAAAAGAAPLRAILDRHGVGRAVALSTRALFYDAHSGNLETVAECAGEGAAGRLLPAAVLDPRAPDAAAAVAELPAAPRLLCLFPATQAWPLADYAPLRRLLRGLAGDAVLSGVPLLCETSRPGDASAFARLLRDADFAAPVVLWNVSGAHLADALAAADDLPSAHIATGDLRGVGEIAFAAAAVGPERVLFGSGAPARSQGAALALVRRAGLSPGASGLVLGGNARRLLSGARDASAAALPAGSSVAA